MIHFAASPDIFFHFLSFDFLRQRCLMPLLACRLIFAIDDAMMLLLRHAADAIC